MLAGLRHPQVEAYSRANNALLGLIRGEQASSRSPRQRRRRAEAKLTRTRALLQSLGDPQHQYAVVHVTGTSGKGSTCAAIASILSAAGYRTGLRTSPYLQVATEKLQIGPSLIDGQSFARMVRLVLEQRRSNSPSDQSPEPLTYAEAWSALALTWFAERQVDIAVVEVGAGGRFDSTNVVQPVVSVITSVGLDHVVSLGPTVADIAWHKAGIIKSGVPAVVGALPADARSVIASVAAAQGSSLITASDWEPGARDSPFAGPDFQRRNAATAYAAIKALREQGFVIPESAVAEGLANARLPGRFERMPGEDPAVWLDGAHNADKMAALAHELSRRPGDRPPPVLVLGMLGAKDASGMIAKLRGIASTIVATEPHVIGKRALPVSRLALILNECDAQRSIICEPDANNALDMACDVARARGTDVLVTGSLYLIGQVRGRWFPDDEIVLKRTPWPLAVDRSDSGFA